MMITNNYTVVVVVIIPSKGKGKRMILISYQITTVWSRRTQCKRPNQGWGPLGSDYLKLSTRDFYKKITTS